MAIIKIFAYLYMNPYKAHNNYCTLFKLTQLLPFNPVILLSADV